MQPLLQVGGRRVVGGQEGDEVDGAAQPGLHLFVGEVVLGLFGGAQQAGQCQPGGQRLLGVPGVVGDPLDLLVPELPAAAHAQRLGDPGVQPVALLAGELVDERLLDQGVREVQAAGVVGVLAEQVGPDGGLQRGGDRFVVGGGAVQQVGVDFRADDGAQPQHPQDGLGQRGEPLAQRLAHPAGYPGEEQVGGAGVVQVPGVADEGEELHDEVGVALAPPVQRGDDLVGHAGAGLCLDEGGDGAPGQAVEPERLRAGGLGGPRKAAGTSWRRTRPRSRGRTGRC
ncbi:hypothetical protein GCM10020000_12050 [Streptomyces olivoverticillatus]